MIIFQWSFSPGVDSVLCLDLFCTPVVVEEEPAPEQLCSEAAAKVMTSSHCVVRNAGTMLPYGNVCLRNKTRQNKTKWQQQEREKNEMIKNIFK